MIDMKKSKDISGGGIRMYVQPSNANRRVLLAFNLWLVFQARCNKAQFDTVYTSQEIYTDFSSQP